jgi:putative transposase
MNELVLDNGREFHSTSLEQACYSMGIELHYAPRRAAWFKGKIERWFRTMNEQVAHGRPGTTFRNIVERGDYNSTEQATIRFGTIKKMIRLWIADVYHQEIHSALQTAPAQMWRSSIASDDITLPKAIRRKTSQRFLVL